jgi:sigma-E factor negative regulatory protein RseC
MITEQGTVTHADASTAWVKTTRSSACQACEARKNCETLINQKEMHVEVENTLNVRMGDHVIIGLETRSMLLMTFLLYIFPVFMLIIGAAAGHKTAPVFNVDPSIFSIFTGFSLFFTAFFILRKKTGTLTDRSQFKPFLVRKKPSRHPDTCTLGSN